MFCLLSFTFIRLGALASRSWDCTHLIPRSRMALFPLTWVFGNRPFFFRMMPIAKKAMQIATINKLMAIVSIILLIFVGAKKCVAKIHIYI